MCTLLFGISLTIRVINCLIVVILSDMVIARKQIYPFTFDRHQKFAFPDLCLGKVIKSEGAGLCVKGVQFKAVL